MGAWRRALEVLVKSRRAVRPSLVGAGAQRLLDSDLRVVITGAGGWVGLATLEMLARLLGPEFSSRVVCFGARERRLKLRGEVEVEQRPIAAMAGLRPTPTIVLHLAFINQVPAMTLDAPGYVAVNRALRESVMGAIDRIGTQAVFQSSSGAVHLADAGAGPQSKGLYGALKLEDEVAFAAWAEGRGATAVIGRLFNLSGPYINRRSSYALSSMIEDAISGRPVRVNATTPVFRSYVSIEILMCVVLGLLTDSAATTVRFETAGDRTVEMGDLAKVVARVLGAPGVDRPVFDPAGPVDRYVGDRRVFAALAQTYGFSRRPLRTQIRQTAAYMANWPEEFLEDTARWK